MNTTVGSFAFDGAKAKIDADVVDRLQAAGLIVFAKDNMGVSVPPRFIHFYADYDRNSEVLKAGR